MHRRVTIHSVPEGALLKVDGKDIGYTPAHFDFTWYGTREVQLLLDGYETRTEMIEVKGGLWMELSSWVGGFLVVIVQ